MAIFNITNKRSGGTVVLPPSYSFPISTNPADRCGRTDYAIVDNTGYHNGTAKSFKIGDTIYSDSGLTTLYNLTSEQKDYNIDGGLFITLDSTSKVIANPC